MTDNLTCTVKGLRDDMPESFFHLADIVEQNVLELYPGNRGTEILIPYMMNDAVEYYLIMEATSLEGEAGSDSDIAEASLTGETGDYMLEIIYTNGTFYRIGFDRLDEACTCYRYHEIAHFWVHGQEAWRRLVYITGTMFDKYAYLGYTFCNEMEMNLKDLILFSPFRYWSPITEAIDERYDYSEEGADLWMTLAGEAGDQEYVRLIRLFKKHPGNPLMTRTLAQALLESARKPLYDLIRQKIQAASVMYPERKYPPAMQQEMAMKKQQAVNHLLENGYEGKWPIYHKGSHYVEITQEMPFTVMESTDFHYAIRYMSWDGSDISNATITDYDGTDPYAHHWENV